MLSTTRDIDSLHRHLHDSWLVAARLPPGNHRCSRDLDLDAVFQSQVLFNFIWFRSNTQQIEGGIMKAVILAAGQGTRIRSVHGERPKCLIGVDNTTILDHQLDALSMVGINDVAIVVGYEKEQIVAHVNARQPLTQKIHFIENPAFAITNNIYSLRLALEWVRGDSFIV